MKLATNLEDKFTVLSVLSIWENFIQVIVVSSWPTEENLLSTGFFIGSPYEPGNGGSQERTC